MDADGLPLVGAGIDYTKVMRWLGLGSTQPPMDEAPTSILLHSSASLSLARSLSRSISALSARGGRNKSNTCYERRRLEEVPCTSLCQFVLGGRMRALRCMSKRRSELSAPCRESWLRLAASAARPQLHQCAPLRVKSFLCTGECAHHNRTRHTFALW